MYNIPDGHAAFGEAFASLFLCAGVSLPQELTFRETWDTGLVSLAL